MSCYTCFIIKKPYNRVYNVLHNVIIHYYDCTSLDGDVEYHVMRKKKYLLKLPFRYLDCETHCHLCKLNNHENMGCCFNTKFFFYNIYQLCQEAKYDWAYNWREDPSRWDWSFYEVEYLYYWYSLSKMLLQQYRPRDLRFFEHFLYALEQIEKAVESGVEYCYNF